MRRTASLARSASRGGNDNPRLSAPYLSDAHAEQIMQVAWRSGVIGRDANMFSNSFKITKGEESADCFLPTGPSVVISEGVVVHENFQPIDQNPQLRISGGLWGRLIQSGEAV